MKRHVVLASAMGGLVAGVGAIGLLAYLGSTVPSKNVAASIGSANDVPELAHDWQLYNGRHWQVAEGNPEDVAATDARENNGGACPAGMIEVQGQMKLDPSANAAYDMNSVEEHQKTTCSKWINRWYPERCEQFDREKWLDVSKDYDTQAMHFCIDRFEYPNRKGEYPVIYVNFHEAQAMCEEEGKRLCNEDEWTFACEGDEATPYPVGYYRDPDACVQDRRWKPFNETAMRPRDGEAARAEMDRLWQGVASGSRDTCKSSFGVYDMTGNVDEWTTRTRPGKYPSILKGGYWGPVRTRCRPSTRSHDENHAFYQQGFRCCSDAPSDSSTASPSSVADDPAANNPVAGSAP